MLEHILRYGIPKEVIDLEYVKTLAKITRKDRIYIICPCGKRQFLKICYVTRTIKKTGSYHCKLCAIKIYQDKKLVKEKELWSDERRQRQSIISKRLWKNAEFRKKQKQSQIVAWNSEEKRQRSSKKIKELWKNDEYRKKQELVKLTDEWKETASERSKNRWKQSEYRNKFEMLWNDQNFLNQFSELAKELWEKDEYRKLQQDLWKDPDRIKKASEKSKEYWNDPENKQKISEKSKEYWNNPVHRKKSKEYWANPVNREKQAKARIEFLKSGKDSIIERISQNILGALNIEYQRHYRLGYYEFDLFIPSHDLLVECQGEYWHSLDKAKQNDASKFTYIDIYFPQYRILYLYERDFLNPGIVKQKLIRELFQNEYENQQIEFSFTDLEIRELSVKDKLEHSFYSAPEEFLQSFHYAGFGRSSKKIFGAYLDNQLIAVCKFAGIVRKEVATSLQYTSSEVLELDRFCIHPQYQKKNFASWFISRCSKLVFTKFSDIKLLVSFADTTYEHSGIIYKAAGWKQISSTKPDYHYINQEGFVLHKKTLYNHAVRMKKTEAEYAKENGYFKVYGKEKIKFIKNK